MDDEENDDDEEVGYPFHQGMPPGFPAGVGGLGGLPGLPGMIGLGGGGKEKLHLSTLELLICTQVTVALMYTEQCHNNLPQILNK